MRPKEIFEKIQRYKVTPVIAIESVNSALDLADTLINGGLPIAEITFRTKAAADVISKLRRERSDLLLGAGTVLTVDNLKKAKECGAMFAVAPGLNPELVGTAKEIGLPFIPGVSNPTDIEQALSLGSKILKFFPAEACGGIKMLKAMSAPYQHTGVKFIPTGGINMSNLQNYLDLPTVIACGGTWIAKKEDIAQARWEEIANRCQEVAQLKT
jgi:2-dehydro-3-deoxyphosphogluconate aldolase/(4S)-4-hydroxy-2-oxoglutarate aldolase